MTSRRRNILSAAVVLALVLVVLASAFGPAVRGRVAAEAARRRLDVTVGSVGLGFFAVRLRNVRLAPKGLSALQARLDEVRVRFDPWLRVSRVEVRGGEVLLQGSTAAIRDAWQSWRASDSSATPNRATTPLDASGLSIRWVDAEVGDIAAEFEGVAGIRENGALRLAVDEGRARSGHGAVSFHRALLELLPSGQLSTARVGSLIAEWKGTEAVPPQSFGGASTSTDVPSTAQGVPGASAPIAALLDPSAPLVPLPNLHAIRARLAALAHLFAERVVEDPQIGVDSLAWKISARSDSAPLTVGPGPVSVARYGRNVEIRFTTDTPAPGTPLALQIRLPTDGNDAELTVEGGPIALPLLGIQEGQAGLVDVAAASIGGRVRAALADGGSALTFDGDVRTRALSLSHPSLAGQTVRGIDLSLRARGIVTSSQFRVDDFGAKLGALALTGSGEVTQSREHVVGSARIEVPATSCESIITSLPAALVPAIAGTTMTGTFAARAALAFDTKTVGDLRLEYAVTDKCRVASVPTPLARERFEHPFVHRIYQPDGTMAEETTGPGTPNWTPLEEISPFMVAAVLTTEDGAFPHHHGFNHAAIRAAIIANLKARRFARGASTITMQVAKNLFLPRDKTFARKLEEVILADYLEQTFSKSELMELYLNIIEFGPGVYGIMAAADYFFGRTPAELNFAESIFLASVLPSPLRYAAMRNGNQPPEAWLRGLRRLMQVAHKTGQITDAELAEAENEPIVFWHGGPRPSPRPPIRPRGAPYDGDDDSPPSFETDDP
ncbi:MAG: transglycosylase domain-containing protein [Myxococcota bacterium]|nr:transglycosylase domain-containing protein [Myxococcota bacterium]